VIEAHALVREVEGDRVFVEVQRRTACGGCESKGSCGTSVVAAWFGRRVSRLWVRSALPLRAGEAVVIGLDEAVLVRASLLVYLLPVAALLGGAVLGSELVGGDLPGIVGGILGLGAGLLASRARASALLWRPDAEVAVLRREAGAVAPEILMDPGPAGNATRRSV
jgi:sigma-E factor negative regulatory protein RseC